MQRAYIYFEIPVDKKPGKPALFLDTKVKLYYCIFDRKHFVVFAICPCIHGIRIIFRKYLKT